MALSPGTRLGPFEVLAPLGAGGMGEVYRAKDTRLERTVALKVLPAHLSSNPDLRQRLEREARTISSLNHPHICTLYDIGHQDGVDYLVMEYLEGETLAQRLSKATAGAVVPAKPPLPMEQVLRYAMEITDALDKAHRQGVTHRDLKPGNIMLTKAGTKLLDFGLAKFRRVDPVVAATTATGLTTDDGRLAAEDKKLTVEGTILGTFQYMAPEQLEGQEADARSDIFALGAVLYEMATGQAAFAGRSKATVIAAILDREPAPISTLQPMTPPALEHLVKRCLAKDPEERWQTAHDIKLQLQWITEAGSQAGMPAPLVTRRKGRERLAWALVAIAAALAAGIAGWSLLRRAEAPRPVARVVIALPPTDRLALGAQPALAISPDGAHLVYAARRGSATQLYLRPTDRFEATPIAATEGAEGPFFSPDGQWIGFFAGQKMKKVPLSGGAPMILCDASGRGASWGPDDTIIFSPRQVAGLLRVSAAGGAPQVLTTPDTKKGEVAYLWPEVLPGGEAVLFTIQTGSATLGDARIAVRSLKTGEQRVLLEGGSHARYSPTGHLIYARAAGLLAAPFDLARLQVKGTPFPILEGIVTDTISGLAQFSFSASGSLVYVTGGPGGPERSLVWVDRKGAARPVTATRRDYIWPRLSPDGRRLALGITEAGNTDIWIYDLARGTLPRLTFEPGMDNYPVWTPDGKRVAYASAKGGPPNIFWKPADGSGPEERLTTSTNLQAPTSWSPDGKALAFAEPDPKTGFDIWVLPMEGERRPRPFLQTPFTESSPRFSPDGRWLAYVSNESGRYQVYVQPYPGPGGKWQISTEGGVEPLWARNGRELFYRHGDQMMAVGVSTQPTFTAGSPRLLFEGPYEPTPLTLANFDVSPDGQQFLMMKSEQESAPTQLHVVLNWFEELKRRVPPGKQ